MSDWEGSDSDPAPPKKPITTNSAPIPKKTKWEGEDEEEDEPVSDWEESSEEEEEQAKPAATALPPKKKGTIKQKIAEKEATKKAAATANNNDSDDDYDSDEVLDPVAKARLDRERELKSDLHNATDLLGAAALGGTSSSELDYLISFQPRTREDFQALSSKIIEYIIKRHQTKPLYHYFVEHHVRELAAPLKDVEVRKAASGLTTLANEKQKEQREKLGGKKKVKAAVKPGLELSKPTNKLDTTMYDESLDDFGNDPADFM